MRMISKDRYGVYCLKKDFVTACESQEFALCLAQDWIPMFFMDWIWAEKCQILQEQWENISWMNTCLKKHCRKQNIYIFQSRTLKHNRQVWKGAVCWYVKNARLLQIEARGFTKGWDLEQACVEQTLCSDWTVCMNCVFQEMCSKWRKCVVKNVCCTQNVREEHTLP